MSSASAARLRLPPRRPVADDVLVMGVGAGTVCVDRVPVAVVGVPVTAVDVAVAGDGMGGWTGCGGMDGDAVNCVSSPSSSVTSTTSSAKIWASWAKVSSNIRPSRLGLGGLGVSAEAEAGAALGWTSFWEYENENT